MFRNVLVLIWAVLICCSTLLASSTIESSAPPKLALARVDTAPTLEDFLDMRPGPRFEGKLAQASGFIQRTPRDGEAGTFKTVAYAAYDDKHLYVVFTCFDPEPNKIRTGVSRREDVGNDDRVVLTLDTFADQRRAYKLIVNASGIEWDGTFSEEFGEDSSWDAVWHARAAVTKEGYVVWMSVPFKSLRFPAGELQNWRIVFARVIPRLNEHDYWPANTTRTAGQLNKSAQTSGLEHISPGRNMQFIPYGVFRASRSTDFTTFPYRFKGEDNKFDGGLDSKIILRDSLVLDTTVNPDFSQVEADAPQVLVNNRFEVYLPEKRPFFLENTNYFTTPLDLLFTRRIADPQFGARLTGKIGKYTLGGLFADDQEPGKIVPSGSPLSGKRAFFGVARVTRDLGDQGTIGLLLTDREFEQASNKVASVDARVKLHSRVVAAAQAVTSQTRFEDGTYLAGPAYWTNLKYQSLNLELETQASYISPGFYTETGYIPQTDIATVQNYVGYTYRPKRKGVLLDLGPSMEIGESWDHNGFEVNRWASTAFTLHFKRESNFAVIWDKYLEHLRPVDFASLASTRPYGHHSWGFHGDVGVWRKYQLCANWRWETRINYVPVSGAPELANAKYMRLVSIFRPSKRFNVRNEYIWLRLSDHIVDTNIFNNHIVRTRFNFQYNKTLSFRFITDYNAVLSNPLGTRLAPDKKINYDFLITYLVHPGTAVHAGYNTNFHNYTRDLATDDNGRLLRTRNTFINDGRQLFVKVSYRFSY